MGAQVGRPFEWALGESIRGLAPAVRDHILQPPGTVVTYRGRMRVTREGGWRGRLTGWLLHLGAIARFMFPDTGDDVDFEIEHAVHRHDDGSLSMSWIRTYRFANTTRRFDAVMRFHPNLGPIVNWYGCWGCLQVELCPRVDGDAIVVVSRRKWVRLGPLRIPIPGLLKGRPHVREQQTANGDLHITVIIRNTLLRRIFGYEGIYSKAETNPQT